LSEDYLPYNQIYSNWVYRVTGEDTLTVEWTVVSREAVSGKEASRIESTEEDFFYSVESGALSEFIRHTVFSFGEVLVLEERWRPKVERPLNLGNRWEDTYVNQVLHQGVTYTIESSLEGLVESIETVFTPVDFFEECYRVSYDIHTRITFPSGDVSEESLRMKEWYAPGVGMIKREVDGGDKWELAEYIVI
jgi:hypothetical protein